MQPLHCMSGVLGKEPPPHCVDCAPALSGIPASLGMSQSRALVDSPWESDLLAGRLASGKDKKLDLYEHEPCRKTQVHFLNGFSQTLAALLS